MLCGCGCGCSHAVAFQPCPKVIPAAHACISCDFAAGFVKFGNEEATKEYTVVSWGEENTLSIICTGAILSGDNVECSDKTILENW